MGKCDIDHSKEDVMAKYMSQEKFLPDKLGQDLLAFLQEDRKQEELNEAFHLLKKYDLASEGERMERDTKFKDLIGTR